MTTDTSTIIAPIKALSVPDAAALTSKAQQTLTFIQSFAINSDEAYQLAGEELRSIKTKAKALEEQRTAITGPLNKATQAVNELFRGPSSLLAQAEAALKSGMLRYTDLVAEQVAAARRQTEAAAEAERQRVAAEAAAQQAEAQAMMAKANEAAAAGDMQAAVIADAEAQRAMSEAAAASVATQAIVAAPVAIKPAKAAGISTSSKVTFQVTDLLALVKHVAENPALINLIAADEVRLRAYVKGLGTACNLPGVRVDIERTMAARAAA